MHEQELIQDLLVHQSERRSQQLAVVGEHAELSYAELEVASNRLARLLLRLGVQRGDRVALCVGRSPAMLVAIYGALKAGCIYVPIDPSFPDERVARIVAHAEPGVLVADHEGVSKIATLPQIQHAVLLDESRTCAKEPRWVSWSDVLREPSHGDGLPRRSEQDVAYLLYTSGSSGLPKGVPISHRNALAFVDWAQREFAVTHEDRVANHASYTFDLSVFDFFAAAKAGATVFPVPGAFLRFPFAVAEWLERREISVLYAVPSALSLLVRRGAIATRRLERLRLVLFAGEVFPAKPLSELMRAVPRARFYNLYGPTETNVITSHEVTSANWDGVRPVPLGKACCGAVLTALRENGEAVSNADQEGELIASGPTVTSGYWHGSAEMQQRFSTRPDGVHTYRTGDWVRVDREGTLHFIGRRDDMVKTRGFRVELGDVEGALLEHGAVEDAAVVTTPHESLGAQLNAFVTLREDADASRGAPLELRNHCVRLLPQYMVPATINVVPLLPRNSNGKVDRRALLHLLQQDSLDATA